MAVAGAGSQDMHTLFDEETGPVGSLQCALRLFVAGADFLVHDGWCRVPGTTARGLYV